MNIYAKRNCMIKNFHIIFLRRFKKNTLLLCFMLFSVNGIIVVVGVSEETQENEVATIY